MIEKRREGEWPITDVLIQSIKNGLKVRYGEFFNIGVDLVDEGVQSMGLGAEKRLE